MRQKFFGCNRASNLFSECCRVPNPHEDLRILFTDSNPLFTDFNLAVQWAYATQNTHIFFINIDFASGSGIDFLSEIRRVYIHVISSVRDNV